MLVPLLLNIPYYFGKLCIPWNTWNSYFISFPTSYNISILDTPLLSLFILPVSDGVSASLGAGHHFLHAFNCWLINLNLSLLFSRASVELIYTQFPHS